MLAWPAMPEMLDHLPAYDAVMPQPGGPGPGRSRSPVPLSTDEGTHFGARAARHLREDLVIWLTTVSATGASAPNTVWFFWNGAATVPMYSLPDAGQVGHLEANPEGIAELRRGRHRRRHRILADGRRGAARSASRRPGPGVPGQVRRAHPSDRLHAERFARHYSLPVTMTLTRLREH